VFPGLFKFYLFADENSNGFQRPGQNRRPLSNYDNCNNGVKHLGNIPGQINVSKGQLKMLTIVINVWLQG
jgi:hypothetical protein